MSMSHVRGIIMEHKGEDLSKLKTVVLKLDEHLKNTNAKLANLRHQIRLEKNPKSRETYLKKSHTMVWEQQTIRRILEDYKKKLIVMVSSDESKQADQQQRQVPARNAKLFELFKNNEAAEKATTDADNTATASAENTEASKEQAEKRKITEETQSTAETGHNATDQFVEKKRRISAEELSTSLVEESTPTQITINTQAEAMKHLAALQEYAMLNDNFRATGLLVQVEKALKKPANSTDFEL